MSDKAYSSSNPYRVSVTWGVFERLEPKIDTSAALTPPDPGARNGIQFMFTGFGAELAPGDKAHRNSAVSAFVVPVTLPAEPPRDSDGSRLTVDFYGYKQILRGVIQKHKDARAVIIVNAAGSTKVVEFPFDVEIGDGDTAQLSGDFEVFFFAVQQLQAAGDPPTYPIPPAFGAEIMISVERRHADASVLVQVDELDVTAAFSSPDGPVSSTK